MTKDIISIIDFKSVTKGIYLYAFGGTPLSEQTSLNKIRYQILCGLGASAVLTYENKSDFDLYHLGKICENKQHFWAYKWMTVSFLICGKSELVEKAFLRDTNFYQSWTVGGDSSRY